MTDEEQLDETVRAPEQRVCALARELVETINAGQAEEREVLREIAINLLREEVQTVDAPNEAAVPPLTGSFNPLGIGIPLLLMGAVLVFLFPLVGLVLFGVAAVVVAWGMGTALLARN